MFLNRLSRLCAEVVSRSSPPGGGTAIELERDQVAYQPGCGERPQTGPPARNNFRCTHNAPVCDLLFDDPKPSRSLRRSAGTGICRSAAGHLGLRETRRILAATDRFRALQCLCDIASGGFDSKGQGVRYKCQPIGGLVEFTKA